MRLSGRDIAPTLNGAPAPYRAHIASYGARDLVVFLETGSAVGLVIFAAMVFTLLGQLRAATPLFPADYVVSVDLPSSQAGTVRDQVAAVPGVSAVAIASSMPGGPIVRSQAARLETDSGTEVLVSRVSADAAIFQTLGVQILRGRSFARTEQGPAAEVVVLSETVARALAPNLDVLGTRVRIGAGTAASAIVIGVSRDVIDYGALSRVGLVPPEVYVPFGPAATGDVVLLARVPGNPHAVMRAIGQAATVPSDARRPRPEVLSENLPYREMGAGGVLIHLFEAFSVVALLLAATGVYGVISQSVAQRTQEFGIRMALGASPRRVLALVLARESRLIGAAIAAGAAITVGLTRTLFAELAVLSAATPVLWVAVAVLCGGLAALSVFMATRRIVRLDPMVVLRRS